MPPDFVVVGHLTRDEHADGSFTLGGAATFASIAARQLGLRAAILTRAAPDFPQPDLLEGIELVRLDSPTTTTFVNDYSAHERRQHVRDIAAPIAADDLPAAWREAPITLLGPLANELGPDMARAFSAQTLVGVAPQGWMRRWDESGLVEHQPWHGAPDILPHAHALFLSEQDLGPFHERLSSYVALAPLVVVTRGDQGCTFYRPGKASVDIPAFPARPVDPTGAGDTFAAAFLIRLRETGDPLVAARFANAAAALAIESFGAASMPTRAEVNARLIGS